MVPTGEAVRQPASVEELNRCQDSVLGSYGIHIFALDKRCSDVHAHITAQRRRICSTKVNKQVTQTGKLILKIESKEEKECKKANEGEADTSPSVQLQLVAAEPRVPKKKTPSPTW